MHLEKTDKKEEKYSYMNWFNENNTSIKKENCDYINQIEGFIWRNKCNCSN